MNESLHCVSHFLATSHSVVLERDEPDVNYNVDGVGQELQRELRLQEGVDLLHMVRDVLADILKQKQDWETGEQKKTPAAATSACR